MSSNKFSDEFKRDAVAQITERGYPVREVSQRLGVSPYSLYAWKKKYSGLESDQVRELKQLQAENEKLKKIVADLTLDKVMLQDLNSRKW